MLLGVVQIQPSWHQELRGERIGGNFKRVPACCKAWQMDFAIEATLVLKHVVPKLVRCREPLQMEIAS